MDRGTHQHCVLFCSAHLALEAVRAAMQLWKYQNVLHIKDKVMSNCREVLLLLQNPWECMACHWSQWGTALGCKLCLHVRCVSIIILAGFRQVMYHLYTSPSPPMKNKWLKLASLVSLSEDSTRWGTFTGNYTMHVPWHSPGMIMNCSFLSISNVELQTKLSPKFKRKMDQKVEWDLSTCYHSFTSYCFFVTELLKFP